MVAIVVKEKPIRERLAGNLRRLRATRGMTQEELSEASGVPRNKISNFEHGHFNLKIETVERLANALGVTIHNLLK